MIIDTIPTLCLQYDPGLGFLRLEWLARADARQFRASAGQLLRLLAQLPVRHLLLDINSIPNLTLADQFWLSDHWMPGLLALDLAQVLLVIGSAQTHNQLAIDAIGSLAQAAIRFKPHYFSDTLSAFDWLANGAPQQPALEAEWAARYRLVPA